MYGTMAMGWRRPDSYSLGARKKGQGAGRVESIKEKGMPTSRYM